MLGYEALEVLNSLNLTPEEGANYDNVIGAMSRFCEPRKNTVYERHNFYKRIQHDGESFDSFLMEIKRLAKSCDFGNAENEMIRDRIVMGVRDSRLQTKLLETDQLTYEVAIRKARACEATSQQTREMNKAETVHEVKTQTASKSNNNKQQQRNYTNNQTNKNSFNNK